MYDRKYKKNSIDNKNRNKYNLDVDTDSGFNNKNFKADNTDSKKIININFNPQQRLLDIYKQNSIRTKNPVKELMELLNIDEEEAKNLI